MKGAKGAAFHARASNSEQDYPAPAVAKPEITPRPMGVPRPVTWAHVGGLQRYFETFASIK